MKKILITAIDSFTGTHLSSYLEKSGYDVYGTSLFKIRNKVYKCDITLRNEIINTLKRVQRHYLIHLTCIQYAAHGE